MAIFNRSQVRRGPRLTVPSKSEALITNEPQHGRQTCGPAALRPPITVEKMRTRPASSSPNRAMNFPDQCRLCSGCGRPESASERLLRPAKQTLRPTLCTRPAKWKRVGYFFKVDDGLLGVAHAERGFPSLLQTNLSDSLSSLPATPVGAQAHPEPALQLAHPPSWPIPSLTDPAGPP